VHEKIAPEEKVSGLGQEKAQNKPGKSSASSKSMRF
jgi:hypothetical protein